MCGFGQVIRRILLAVVAAAAIMMGTCLVHAQQAATRTVRVTAQGATYDAAHDQAVRQALQQVVQQLVLADREVVNNTLIRDKVMSTMNGYVDNYKTLSKSRQPDGSWLVDEEITISQTRIANFLGTTKKGAAELSGGLLSTDSQREISQRKVLGEIFDRLLQPLPSRAIELQYESVKVDERNPNQFVVSLKTSLSKEWLESFRGAMSALAIDGFRYPHNLTSGFDPRSGFYPAPYYKLKRPVASSLVCVIDDANFDCFLLPPGHYGERTLMRGEDMAGAFEAPPISLAIRFIDAAGRSTLAGNRPCVMKKMEHGKWPIIGRKHGTGSLGRDYYVFGTTMNGNVVVDSSEVNMGATTRFAAVPFFAARQFGGYISLHSGNIRRPDDPGVLAISDLSSLKVPQADVCGEMLDDAVDARKLIKG